MNIDMERTTFTSLLESSQFGGPLQVSQQPLMHSEAEPVFELQDTLSMETPPFLMKQHPIEQHAPTLASNDVKPPANQSVPNVLRNMMNSSNSSKLTPTSAEASLLSLVDNELRVSSISNLSIFLQFLPQCKTEPEQTLALVVLRATSTASDAKLSRACASAFEKSGGLRLARKWVDFAVTWQLNDLLVLLLEVLQTLPLQLTSITEARINEPIVKLRKNACEERVKRAAQDLLKFWRGKFTEKEKPSAISSVAKEKSREMLSASKSSSSTTPSAKQVSSIAASASKSVSLKQPKVTKKRTMKRLERLPFGGGSAVSKSSDLIGSLMQRKLAKDAAIAAAAAEEERKNTSSNIISSSKSDIVKDEETQAEKSSSASEDLISADDDTLSMPLPTIQSFKVASSTTGVTKERKCIRWADESGEELVKVKLIESWRDLVPYDPRHDDQSFKDAKLREHANERHALLAQHHKVPPAVAASQSREWTTPPFMQLPEVVEGREDGKTVTDEMQVQDSRRRHVDEYEILAGEMSVPSPKEWERGNEPHVGPPFEIPLSDLVEGNASNEIPPSSAPMKAALPISSSSPKYSQERYAAGGYVEASRNYDQRSFSRSEYNGCQDPEADRKLREALGPLQENTVSLLLDNPDVVPQVLEEAQRHGNRISDARVFEIVDQYRRGRYQAPPNASGQPPAYSPYGSQQQQQHHFGGMGPGVVYGHQYHQQYPLQQGLPGGSFLSGKRKADSLSANQNGLMPDALQSRKRLTKKARGLLSCRFFTSPMGCKNGGNCHYAHVQPPPANGLELIYNNNNGPIMGGHGSDHMERYGYVSMPRGGPGHHQIHGGR